MWGVERRDTSEVRLVCDLSAAWCALFNIVILDDDALRVHVH